MKKRGITLAEVMVAALILALGLGAMLSVYISASLSIQQAKNLSFATQDAGIVLETVRSLNRTDIRNCVNTTCWNITTLLPDENITVINGNASDTNWANDPLELQVSVSWSERGQTNTISMISKFTDD